MLRVSGLAEWRAWLESVRLEDVMARALAVQAEGMAAAVRAGLSEVPGSGGHERPWARSGALRDSVGHSAAGLQAAVGSSDAAAVPQEMGTARVPPRPFLAPVGAGMGAGAAREIGGAVAAALLGGPGAGPTGDRTGENIP